MALYPERKRFQALNQQERVERGDGRTKISQAFYSGTDDKLDVSKGTTDPEYIVKYESVIAFGRFSKLFEFTISPVVISAINDDSSNAGSMSADPFGGRLNDNMCTMLQWTEQVSGSAEGIVYN
ncbi:hypothetical protein D3C86_1562530 [compost metagenome]